MRGFWENIRHFIPRIRFFLMFIFIFIFFFKVEISSRTLIPLFRSESVNGGSASSDDCDLVFPDELHVSSFPDRSPDYAWTAALSAHSDFVGPKVYACLGVSCQLHVLQNGQLPK